MATATNETVTPGTPAVYRTPEQEARLAELGRMFATVIMTPEQAIERTRLLRMAPCPTPLPPVIPPRPRIRVKVWRDDYREWQVMIKVGEGNRELPSITCD